MQIYDENKTKQFLLELDPKSRVAFAAAAATRQLCCYEILMKSLKRDFNFLYDTANLLWSSINSDIVDSDFWLRKIDEIQKLFPNNGENEWVDASPDKGWLIYAASDDAIVSWIYAARCLLSKDVQDAVWAARRAYESVDQVAISFLKINPTKNEVAVLRHEIVQRELSRQNIDLMDLKRFSFEKIKQNSLNNQIYTHAELREMSEISHKN